MKQLNMDDLDIEDKMVDSSSSDDTSSETSEGSYSSEGGSVDNDESTADLDDVDLLKTCSREDLFMLIKTDPKYYLSLIKSNQLENQLNILVRRSDDGGGLHLKFKIYPDDRWSEVGYWGSNDDDEVYADFVDQIGILLTRSRAGEGGGISKKYPHLESQLDANNNVMSLDYGSDIKKLIQNNDGVGGASKQGTSGISIGAGNMVRTGGRQLNAHNLSELNRMNATVDRIKNESHLISLTEEEKKTKKTDKTNNTESVLTSSEDPDPVSEFKHELIEKIIRQVPSLLKLDQTQNYDHIIRSLNDTKILNQSIPDAYAMSHNQLLEKIKGCQYIQRVHNMADWKSYPELYDYLVDFHRTGMRENPTLYYFSKESLENLLDDDDKEILKSYVMDIKDVWFDYLKDSEYC